MEHQLIAKKGNKSWK